MRADVKMEGQVRGAGESGRSPMRVGWRASANSSLLAGAILILLVAGPFLFGAYLLNVLIQAFFFAIVAVTVDLLWGYAGYLTFGQAAFFGVGSYAAALVLTHGGLSFNHVTMALISAIAGAAAVGGVLGWLSFYRGASPFFATVLSLVLPIVFSRLLLSGGVWTGSSSGLTGYETLDLSLRAWYWIAGGSMLTIAMIVWLFVRSDWGRLLPAIRDNESRCAYLGINTSAVKIAILLAAAIIASVAGFGYALFSDVVAPQLGGFVLGTELVIWVALGGRGTVWGPVAGAILINVATSYLSGWMPFAWQLILGGCFVGVIVLLPQGLLPWLVGPFVRRGESTIRHALTERALRPVAATGPSKNVLEMNGVRKDFGNLKVLQGIDLTGRAGELIGLIGPNGAGKTTLMRCLSDGAERTAGDISLGDEPLGRLAPEGCVRLGLGRKFQNANIFESLTVVECLKIAGTIIERPSLFRNRKEVALPSYSLGVLRATNLEDQLEVPARDLSHGQQQALELAMVLALEPRIVLLDEPTAGLSKAERARIGSVIQALARDHRICCLLVEHDLDFVAEVATRIAVLHQGRVVMQGNFSEVVNSELVKAIYAGTAKTLGAENASTKGEMA